MVFSEILCPKYSISFCIKRYFSQFDGFITPSFVRNFIKSFISFFSTTVTYKGIMGRIFYFEATFLSADVEAI